MKFETHTLKNGMKVLLAPIEGAETVTVMVMSGTGSRYESEKENGMAHFLEHMVFKGTKERKNAKIIAEELDKVGGQFNAFTSKDHTAYFAKTDRKHFDTALSVISDIFLNPTLPSHEIKREKGTITEEINMYEDMPIRSVLDEADKTLFGENHPLGRTILGPKSNIAAFTRKDFITYFKRNYVAENSAVCIAGSFSQASALKKVRKIFSDMRTGPIPTFTPYTHTQTKPQVRLKYKNTDQTHLVIATPSLPMHHPDEMVPEVIAAILGGGMSSRLFTEVRERRGLAYYVRAENDQYPDISNLYMRAGVANASVEQAITTILNELKKIKKTIVSTQELKKAKEYLKGTAAISLDTTDAKAQYIGYTTLVRKSTKGLDAYNKAVDEVTPKQVKKVAQELFQTDTLNLTIIGPHKENEVFNKLLRV